MMPTDDERREVARKLRELESYSFDDGGYIDRGEVECVLGLVCDDGAWYEEEGVMRLADLIEPSEPKAKCVAEVKVDGERLEELVHDAAVELTGIDRDALLELADEMELGRDSVAAHGGLVSYKESAICGYARRIREALGVES